MYNHEPPGYECPLCQIVRGEDNEPPWSTQDDVVYRDDLTTVWINARYWGRNLGAVVVVPNLHFENIFDLPTRLAEPIHATARRVAIGFMEAYACDGVSTRQHNAPAGNQDAWHYHLHVFPRYAGDGLYGAERRHSTPAERAPYAAKLRAFMRA